MKSKIIKLENVRSQHLQNERDVYVYLPPSYDVNLTARYPVVYAHDGQHIFQADSKGGSWDMHLAADHLAREGTMREIIIVAVASIPDQRISEYFHNKEGLENVFYTEFRGELYEQFLIEELKPMIDTQFRTLSDRNHTALIGSSAGGLVTYHIGFRRPDVFGHLAILSPFFVQAIINEQSTGKESLEETAIYSKFQHKPPVNVWMDIGGTEGTITVAQVREVADQLIGLGFVPGSDLVFWYDPAAGHSQKDWAQRVHAPLLQFFGKRGIPQKLEIIGRTVMGLNESKVRLYPNVFYDTGFHMSLLKAAYTVDNPEVVAVQPDGTLVPVMEGNATVFVDFEGLRAAARIEVVRELASTVEIDISVEVPDNTPSDSQVHAGFPIPKVRDGLYQGRFQVPRDLSFDVKVSRGFGLHEKREGNRKFKASEPLKLHFVVEEWEEQC